jgi:hypothetical protein
MNFPPETFFFYFLPNWSGLLPWGTGGISFEASNQQKRPAQSWPFPHFSYFAV